MFNYVTHINPKFCLQNITMSKHHLHCYIKFINNTSSLHKHKANVRCSQPYSFHRYTFSMFFLVLFSGKIFVFSFECFVYSLMRKKRTSYLFIWSPDLFTLYPRRNITSKGLQNKILFKHGFTKTKHRDFKMFTITEVKFHTSFFSINFNTNITIQHSFFIEFLGN